jgi:DNA-binding CsgD family transcriptional regulator
MKYFDTPANAKRFKELYYAGFTDAAIANELGFKSITVGNYRRKLGLAIVVRSKPPNWYDTEIIELVQSGASVGVIARKLRISKKKVDERLSILNYAKKPGTIRERMLELYELDYNDEEIASRLKIKKNTVSAWRSRYKLMYPRPKAIEPPIRHHILKGDDSLYCDTAFLEMFFGKKLETKDCD